MRIFLTTLLLLALAGCGDLAVGPRPVGPGPVGPAPGPLSAPPDIALSRPPASGLARNFVQVVDDVLPVAVRECRARTVAMRCDFAIVIDDSPGAPPNAFQTIGPDGQPIVGFTLALIGEARNRDELAFILGHEAAHHIAGHIGRGRASAVTGATLAGALASLGGGDAVMVERAQNVGALLGSRRFSKGFELEADALGAILSRQAGYDPINGVAFFSRAPDPGNQFLGTHPPNAQRIEVVRRALAGL